jgi:mannitol-1-phosphate/altronate dehydrogenase
VGADGSEKLRQRLLPVVERREQRGRSTARLAVVAALWQASVTGTPLRGKRLPRVDDPGPTRLPASPAFTGEVAGTLERLMRDGVDVLRDAP